MKYFLTHSILYQPVQFPIDTYTLRGTTKYLWEKHVSVTISYTAATTSLAKTMSRKLSRYLMHNDKLIFYIRYFFVSYENSQNLPFTKTILRKRENQRSPIKLVRKLSLKPSAICRNSNGTKFQQIYNTWSTTRYTALEPISIPSRNLI